MKPDRRRATLAVELVVVELAVVPLAVVALALCLAAPAGAISSDPELERLERALLQYPDDPDLMWAHAQALSRRGRSADALDVLRNFARHYPQRRSDLQLELGRALFESGDVDAALEALERAVARQPEIAAAHFYHGLALRELGRVTDAREALDRAASLSPALLPEVKLVHGIDLLDAGDEGAADALFRELLELAPASRAADRARLLMLDRLAHRKRWFRLDAFAGMEWDSNVTLEDGTGALAPTASDPVGSWGAGVTLRPWQGRRTGLDVGYLYDQNAHVAFDDYDVLGNSLWLSGRYRPWARVQVHTDVLASDLRRAGSTYLRSVTGRVRASYVWSEEIGATSIQARVGWRDFLDASPVEEELLTRDGLEWSLSARHSISLWRPDAWLSAGFLYRRTQTAGAPEGTLADSLGGPSYDASRYEGQLRAGLPLPFEVELSTRLRVGHDRFDHRNFFIFVDQLELDERRDTYGELRIALERSIAPYTRIELAWSGTLRSSNASTFRYDRQRVGLYFRVASE